LLALLRAGETTESVRKMIGRGTSYRLAVLRAFDSHLERKTAAVIDRKNDLHIVSSRRRRGQRLPPQLKQKIVARVRAGARFVDLRREFGIVYCTMWHMRRAVGDYEDRRRRSYRKRDDA